MQDWYLAIKDKYALTTILFTHHIDEALRMSDVIHVLSPKKKSIAYTHRIPEEVKRKDSVGFYLCAANASSMA